ncbi:MAG: FtsX-like permease family protein [Lachnospiraceae bacterium]|nr:FtsX-like permease family protein [Lachnospiraceae bacterium]
MEKKILWKSGLKRHQSSITGIFVLIFLVTVSLSSALTLWQCSGSYIRQEMERLGYGDMTVWVSGLSDVTPLTEEINHLSEIKTVGVQNILYSEYETNEQESDSEGQLIVYEPEKYDYKILKDNLNGYRSAAGDIISGTIWVSASMQSMFGVQIGDTITFPIARSGVNKSFTVTGYFEDPFMGSSMIGMKSFLICRADYEDICSSIEKSGADGLARQGHMLHIFKNGDFSASKLNRLLNESTSLTQYTEFTHSFDVMSGFMLTLQNVFTGLLLSFVAILVVVSIVVLSHSIGASIEMDRKNMGILKTLGCTSGLLRRVQMFQYLTGMIPGMLLGVLASVPVSIYLCRMTVTTTGLLIPANIPVILCGGTLLLFLILFCGFIWLRTRQLTAVTPMIAIRENDVQAAGRKRLPIREKPLSFWLALRQLESGRKRYIGVFLTAVLLVFIASFMGRVNSWLGPRGEGLMDAFNPAGLHMAAQPMGETGIEDVEKTIRSYTAITDQYALAMPTVSVEGIDYTANVITDPKRFHMLSGNTCNGEDEILLTEFVAADLGVSIGDRITVSGPKNSAEFRVSGIYQCANDMGANVGLSRDGFLRIGEDSLNIWCHHYFLENQELSQTVMQALEETYGGDVYLHENSWPGLYGILSAMKLLLIFLYGIVLVFVLVVTRLVSGKLLMREQKDLGIYRAMGMSSRALRLSFALRFAMVSSLGSLFGVLLGIFFTDPLAALILRMEGISNFSSHPGILTVLLPAVVVTVMFTGFAYMASTKIKEMTLTNLITE